MNCPKLFDWENRLSADTCAQSLRANENSSIYDYNTYSSFGSCDSECDKKKELLGKYPNLRYKNGYGVSSSCSIDDDSGMRFISPTHGPEKKQLFVRNFQAVPNTGSGCLNILGTDSYLKNGQDSTLIPCANLEEKSFDRFIPLQPCMNQYIMGAGKNVGDIPYGANTREMWRCIASKK